MKTSTKILAAAGFALAALGSTSAMARDHVSFGLSIGVPGPYYAPPAPVYVQPPQYYAPPAYYAPPPVVYSRPAPVYVAPPAVAYYGGGYYGRGYYGPGYYRGYGHHHR
jgi:hypothetical protein